MASSTHPSEHRRCCTCNLNPPPTRGIDVGAKFEIYKLMVGLARQGKGIVMISSELPELLGMCDRIYVMGGGRVNGMLTPDEYSQESIMRLATGVRRGA